MVSLLEFDHETKRLVREGVPNEVNPFDVLAMSAVCDLKREVPIEAVAITMGPPQARDALVQCLAMGADWAIHLVDPAFAGSDTLATARALSIALAPEAFDLIVCGLHSVDSETGQVGPEVAEFLGLPQVTGVRSIEVVDSGKGIRVEKVTDVGHDLVYCSLPALVTVTEGVAPETYPSREAMEAARDKPISELTASQLSEDETLFGTGGSPTWVSEIYSIEPNREAIVVRDTPVEDAVNRLLDYLERRGTFQQLDRSLPSVGPRGPRRRISGAGAIWVVAELMRDDVRRVSLELLGRAGELAAQISSGVEAILIGHDADRHAPILTAYGADCVHIADDPHLQEYDTEAFATILSEAIRTHRPYAVLVPSTINGRDVASRVAGRLGLGLTGDCVGLEINDGGRLVQLKPAFGGNIVAPILSRTMPQMATIRPGILSPVEPDGSIEPMISELPVAEPGASRAKVLERVVDGSIEETDLEEARIVVAFGKGVGSTDDLDVVRELARVLGASLGTTRDVVEAGWMPSQYQIGLSGKAVSPDLYIAVALRGPFNHTVGIQKAGTVVAINNSLRAPIFKASDFGILGDYAEVVPAFISAYKRRRAR